MSSTQGNKRVAIVVPMSNRAELSPDEEISLHHLTHYLGAYDRYLILPESLDFERDGYRLARFPDKYFGSALANTKLMLSRMVYERFIDYEYMLIYHLDALVFSDDLEKWCDAGYDYIGPPWFHTKDTTWVKEPGVGNGGFCLRHVKNSLKVLRSKRYAVEPDEYWRRYSAQTKGIKRYLNYPRKYLKYLHRFNNVDREVKNFNRNEDKFWSFRATQYLPEYKIAPVDVALQFAFEGAPRMCYEKNGRKLPFGCHAWPKFDREFWDEFLLKSPT